MAIGTYEPLPKGVQRIGNGTLDSDSSEEDEGSETEEESDSEIEIIDTNDNGKNKSKSNGKGKSKEKVIGWVYVGSHNFTPSAWGTISGSSFTPILNVSPFFA